MNRRGFLAAMGGAALAPGLVRAATSQRAITSQRVVVAGGAITEMVYALGAADRLVGVDTTSLYPAAADKLPKIGYFRQLSAEGILSLNPSLLLVSDQAGPLAALEKLRAVKLQLAVIRETMNVADVPDKMRQVAEALDCRAQGERLAQELQGQIEALNNAVAKIAQRPRVLFLMSISDGRLLAAGDVTAAETMIKFAGGRNAMVGTNGYKPISAEAAFAADPDVILISDQSLAALGGLDGLRKLPQLSALRATQASRVVMLDMLFLLGLGPRVARAGRALAAALHPAAALPSFDA